MSKAPTITAEGIKEEIEWSYFFVVPDTTLTICVLGLSNGFTVTGESACVSPEKFNAAMGEQIAYDNAFNKIWQLEGYRLACRLAEE